MARITREEVIKLAQISNIELHEQEIEPITQQLATILEYVARIQQAAATHVEIPSHKAINVWREDVAVESDPEIILAQAPEVEEHYFVVPRILESNQ